MDVLPKCEASELTAMTNLKTASAVLAAMAVISAVTVGYFFPFSRAVAQESTTMTTTQASTQTTTKITQSTTTTTQAGGGSPQSTVAVASKSSIGSYLSNGSGWTLYTFKQDTPNSGTSACNGNCQKTWPSFHVSTLVVPEGLSASSFATITRADGSKQTTFNGHPLYYFAADKKAGDTNGQGIGGVWFAASPIAGGNTSTTTTTSSTTIRVGYGY